MLEFSASTPMSTVVFETYVAVNKTETQF